MATVINDDDIKEYLNGYHSLKLEMEKMEFTLKLEMERKKFMLKTEMEKMEIGKKSQMERKEFSLKSQTLFKKYENPFEFCSFCLCFFAKEQLSGANNYLPIIIMTEFDRFISLNHFNCICSPLLTEDIRKKAFECLFLIKDLRVKRSLIKCFGLNTDPGVYVSIISSKIKEGSSMEHLVSVIETMKFGSLINVDNVLLPLYLMNHYEIIEELLKHELCEISSAFKLKAIINNICTRRYQVSDLKRMYNIKHIPCKRSIVIRDFGYRLDDFVHRAHLSLITANKETLAYLFRSHYKKCAMTLESLVLYAADLAKHDRKVMDKFILNLFKRYDDYYGAKMYWDRVRGSEVYDHPVVANLKYKNCTPKRHVKNICTEWYKLKLSVEDVITVDNQTQYDEAMAHLQSCKVIAIDLEWKSAHKYDEPEKISLLQIASQEKVYLMDMKILCLTLKEDSWKTLGEIFSNENILKLTYHSAGDDIKLRGFNHHLSKMKSCLDLHDIGLALLKRHPNVYSFKTVDFKGLSGLVFLCFGKPLDKMEQCSYWDLRPLTTSQVIYAALDAFCLIDIYNYIEEQAEKLNISGWKELKPEKVFSCKYPSDLVKGQSELRIVDVKFICDNMLRKLCQQLMSKNIDTKLVNPEEGHDKCFEFLENEDRIILTNKTIYLKMRNFVPDSHILCIEEESDVLKQLAQVQSHFKV